MDKLTLEVLEIPSGAEVKEIVLERRGKITKIEIPSSFADYGDDFQICLT